MKRLLGLLLILAANMAKAAVSVHVFVSFSMPETLLIQTFKEAERLDVPVYINGFHKNSMKLTAQKIMEYSEKVPNLNLQIDPTAFDKYGINQVPAVVVDNGKVFDVIYGNLKLAASLERIATLGESGFDSQKLKERQA